MAGDVERAMKLLPHWMEHNAEHAEEFRQWAQRVRATGAGEAADHIVSAAEAMERARDELAAALAGLGQA